MKMKSFIIGGLGCLGLLAVSCSDNDSKYTPAPAQPIAPAYFSTAENGTSFEIDDPNATSATLKIYRNDASEEYTANVNLKSDDNLIKTDPTVTFGVNEREATITLIFDCMELGAATPRNFELSIAGTEDCPYYLGTISGTITYVPWKSVGLVNYTDDFIAGIFTSVPPVSWEVELQEHPTQKGYYRLINPYATYPYAEDGDFDYSKDYNLFIHAEDPNFVWVPEFETGLDFGYGMIKAISLVDYFMQQGNDLDLIMEKRPDLFGKLAGGIISFPKNSFYTAMADFEGGEWYWYGNSNGKMRVVWPMEGPEWEQVGEAQYTDGLIPPMFFDEAPYTYPVMIEHSVIDDGLYRMVNPYKAGVCPYGTAYDGDKYIEIDATNPDCIVMALQETGLVDEELGSISILNFTYLLQLNGYDDDTIIGAGFNDTFANGLFTFNAPEGEQGNESDLMICFPETDPDMNLYVSDQPSYIALPGAQVEMSAKYYVTNGAKIVKRNLQKSSYDFGFDKIMRHKKVERIK